MRKSLVVGLLALLLVPSLAAASPRFRFESGQVAPPLDPVPYFYVTANDGTSGQNACQSGDGTCLTPPAVSAPVAPVGADQRPATTDVARDVARRPSRRRTPSTTPARRGGRAGDDYASKICGAVPSNVDCAAGGSRQTSGGGEKVSHRGWPAVTGVLWKVLDSSSRNKVGGALNDELLGHHGSDRISGGAGRDILWGDWDPRNNNTRQRDVLRGGPGADYIYPSHGRTVVDGGSGNDYIWAFYGKGTINCGPGKDTVHVRMNGAFKLRGCEVIKHFCSFGSDAKGNCLKPGEKARRRS